MRGEASSYLGGSDAGPRTGNFEALARRRDDILLRPDLLIRFDRSDRILVPEDRTIDDITQNMAWIATIVSRRVPLFLGGRGIEKCAHIRISLSIDEINIRF